MAIRLHADLPQVELLRSRLENMIDINYPLVKLGQGIDWEVFDREFGKHHATKVGIAATRTRLIGGLTYFQFMYDILAKRFRVQQRNSNDKVYTL